MSRRDWTRLLAVAWALGPASRVAADDSVDLPGEAWIVASPAACEGAADTLSSYETVIRAQATAALRQGSRTPRLIDTRGHLLQALAELQARNRRGWLLLFLSGHGMIDGGSSRVCVGDGKARGEWLDVDRELLPALPRSLSGAVIVLDACSSAQVDPSLASIPVAIISASPHLVETGALFGAMILASLSAASDDNCNGVFDDDDLFSGLMHRMRATLSLVALEASPKLRRNAPSPLPIPVRAAATERCARLTAKATRLASTVGLPKPLVEQRGVQDGLGRGSLALPRSNHDFFVLSGGAELDRGMVRRLAAAAHLEELVGLGADQAATLAATTTFAEIYRLDLSAGWMQTWRLRDGLLVSAVRIGRAACGLPLRAVLSRTERVIPGLAPRYSQARRYLREVRDPQGFATACFEPEGQCFVEPVDHRPVEECEP